MSDGKVSVRYMVDDVDQALDFYTENFGFEPGHNASPAAEVSKGNLRLLLAGPESPAGRPMPDGRRPEPGGWNRIHFVVDDIGAEVERLRAAGVSFRNDIVMDPAVNRSSSTTLRNPIEIFQPANQGRRLTVGADCGVYAADDEAANNSCSRSRPLR